MLTRFARLSKSHSSGFTTSASFASKSYWSDDDCLEYLKYKLNCECVNKKGWNNNMSLVNQEGQAGDISWSLVYWKFDFLKKGVPIIIPFKLEPDERAILRATTDLHQIKNNAIFWSQEQNKIAIGELREALVEGFYHRVIHGFSWAKSGLEGIKHNRKLHRNKIRR